MGVALTETTRQKSPHLSILLLCLLLPAHGAADTTTESTGEALRQKYVGSYDTDALLNEPVIMLRLEQLLGVELEHFRSNLDVRGSVDLISDTLSLSGNAVHGGGLEEAVLCVSGYEASQISAAIFSEGRITIYSHSPDYDAQVRCIKDWITQVNSGHRDRFLAPSNVRIVASQ